MTDRLGRLIPGAFADLLIVDGDPLADLSCLAGQGERISMVMKGDGSIIHRTDADFSANDYNVGLSLPPTMPIYAYRCAECGFQKDVLQKLSDAALTVCPSCGTASFSKQLSAPAFQLKGTGWYVTDFRDNGKTADKAEKDGPAAEKEGDGAKGGDGVKSEPGAAGAGKPAGDGPSAGGPAGDRAAGAASPKPDAKPTPDAAPVKPAAAAPTAPKPTSGAGPGGG